MISNAAFTVRSLAEVEEGQLHHRGLTQLHRYSCHEMRFIGGILTVKHLEKYQIPTNVD